MENKRKMTVCPFPDEASVFMGICTPEPCTCCGREGSDSLYVVKIDGNRDDIRLIFCADCLDLLYNETGHVLHRSVKTGDTVWELVLCDCDEWKIFPMIVKSVVPYGSIRHTKGEEPVIWNIYAENDLAYMYKSFYDVGKTLFLTEEAKQALNERQKGI